MSAELGLALNPDERFGTYVAKLVRNAEDGKSAIRTVARAGIDECADVHAAARGTVSGTWHRGRARRIHRTVA